MARVKIKRIVCITIILTIEKISMKNNKVNKDRHKGKGSMMG